MKENKTPRDQAMYTKSHSKHRGDLNPDLSSSRTSALSILHRASKVMAKCVTSTEKCFLRRMIFKRHLIDEMVQVEI